MNRRTVLQSIVALIAAPFAFIRWHWGAWRYGTTSIIVAGLDVMEGDVLVYDYHLKAVRDADVLDSRMDPFYEFMTVESVDGNTVTVRRGEVNGRIEGISSHPTGKHIRLFRDSTELKGANLNLGASVAVTDKYIDQIFIV